VYAYIKKKQKKEKTDTVMVQARRINSRETAGKKDLEDIIKLPVHEELGAAAELTERYVKGKTYDEVLSPILSSSNT
jgi:hypothetical protein